MQPASKHPIIHPAKSNHLTRNSFVWQFACNQTIIQYVPVSAISVLKRLYRLSKSWLSIPKCHKCVKRLPSNLSLLRRPSMRYFLGFGLKKVLFISDAVHTNAINESFLDMADVHENLQPAITFWGWIGWQWLEFRVTSNLTSGILEFRVTSSWSFG